MLAAHWLRAFRAVVASGSPSADLVCHRLQFLWSIRRIEHGEGFTRSEVDRRPPTDGR